MVEARRSGLSPPLGGLHDIRCGMFAVRKLGAMLEPEELAETAETLGALGYLDRWLTRVGEQFPRLGGLRQGVGEFSGVATAIEGCLDSRAKVLDTASRRLSMLRREIGQAEEKIQETLRRMLRSPEIKRILRYPNFTMVGHHYVLPVAKDHRGELQGSVQRSSATNETVYIEPTAISEQSAQLSYLRSREVKEIRLDLAPAHAQVGMVADSLLQTLAIMAELDLIHARARFSLDYRMSTPDMNDEGRLVLRQARHPLLEAIVLNDLALPATDSAPLAGGDDGRRAYSFRGSDRRPSGRAVPDHGRHGSQHGGKDGRAEDRGPAGDHGPERPARAGSRRLAASGLRPGARRYRRRAEPRAIALDFFVACAADFPDPGPGDTRLAGLAR